MGISSGSNDLHHTNPTVKLALLLGKFRVAGFQKRSIAAVAAMMDRRRIPGKYTIRLPVLSMNIEYLVMVPFRDSDEQFQGLFMELLKSARVSRFSDSGGPGPSQDL